MIFYFIRINFIIYNELFLKKLNEIFLFFWKTLLPPSNYDFKIIAKYVLCSQPTEE